MCFICQEPWDDPRCLSCDHAFCLRCLEQYTAANSRTLQHSIPCPLCQNKTTMPDLGLETLPKMSTNPANSEVQSNTVCQLCVMHMNGRFIIYYVPARETLTFLKKVIARNTGIPEEDQRLLYKRHDQRDDSPMIELLRSINYDRTEDKWFRWICFDQKIKQITFISRN